MTRGSIVFAYDPAALPLGFDETTLAIFHYHAGVWEKLVGTADVANHKIAAVTTSLSPFALGFSPGISVQMPAGGGTVAGSGSYAIGASVTLTATPQVDYWFTGWTDGGTVVSNSRTYTFTMTGSRALSANFELMPKLNVAAATANTRTFKWPATATGWVLQESSDLTTWVNSTRAIAPVGGENTVTTNTAAGPVFFRLAHP